MNKGKIITRIVAGLMVVFMVFGSISTFLFYLLSK